MSVSRVKRQFEEFATYLGRDATGQEKLKKLKDAVNELRTRLATAETKAIHAMDAAEAVRQRAQATESDLSDALAEIQRLQQINRNLMRDMAIATAPAVDEEPDAAPSGDYAESEVKRVLKKLRDRLRLCPAPDRVLVKHSKKDVTRVWNREEIAKGWSHDSIWTLGAAVAALAFLDGIVAIETKKLARDVFGRATDANADESGWRPLIQWMSKCLSDTDEVSAALYRATSEKNASYLFPPGCR